MHKILFLIFFFAEVCCACTVCGSQVGLDSEFFGKFGIPFDGKLEKLRGGLSSSEVYKLDSCVVRILDSCLDKQKRLDELMLHKYLASKDMAPKLISVDDDADPHVIVMDYIRGRNFDFEKDLANVEIRQQIVNILRTIHQSGLRIQSADTIVEQIRNFKYVESRFPTDLEKWRDSLLTEAEEYRNTPVPVHGDLSCMNILISDSGQVYFIDFQEVRMDSIYSELGYFLYESGVDAPDAIRCFLKEYFGRDPTQHESDAISFYMRATAFLCGIYLSNWVDPGFNSDALDNILKNLKKRGIDYFKNERYDKMDLENMTPDQRAEYVLSFYRDCERRD